MTFVPRQSAKYTFLLLLLICGPLPAAQKAESKGGVVVSGSPQSTEAGIRILKQGGTAADAAVAVSLTLGVTEPFNSGLGGKLVVLYYEAASGKISYLEALETAPLGMSVEAMRALPAEDRQRLAEAWLQQTRAMGYGRLELLGPQGDTVGRSALVGDGMIVLTPRPRPTPPSP